ncbi:hypothetical protein ACFU99_43920 [Streptomyces sp. NPDC057654]|uniref:hypothetical protein n=1 Tax=Streptomyces sp. NPDC057654 TaxID=3346196 RepID=UPI0036744778
MFDLINSRMRQFEHLVAKELPLLTADYGPGIGRELGRYADGLKDWMSGIKKWHDDVDRYKERSLRERYGRGESECEEPEIALKALPIGPPRGLGTSAARLVESLSARV